MPALKDYEAVVGKDVMEVLWSLAGPLRGKTICNVNATRVGGGVAEILNRMVPLFQELGVAARWDIIKGDNDFYAVTKKFHNALHGDPVDLTAKDYAVFDAMSEKNLAEMDLGADVMFIHDPQPAALVRRRKEFKNRWIWRCHIDLSRRDEGVWRFLSPMVESYDAAVFSAPAFCQDLAIPQALIAPSIDPLAEKNISLEKFEVDKIMDRLQIPRDLPLLTQVSRFDRLKDPVGVIQAFRRVRQEIPCRLVLVGGSADDDPEGAQVLAEVREAAEGEKDVLILALPPTSHREINAIQRASAVIIQKSLREGFGLTVTEGLWKGKPLVAGAVGGIPLQVLHKQTGMLVRSVDECAAALKELLAKPDWAKKLGENGRRHVQQNFLITRHMQEYMQLFHSVLNPGNDIVRLEAVAAGG